MIIDQAHSTVQTNLGGKTNFRLKESGKLFQLLSSSLYSNKYGSVVREYSSNCYDAHVMVGKEDVPFEVHLPTHLDENMRFRDFGPGLSEEDIVNVFTTYGESTKNESNSSIGGYGLGCKSAFAVAKTWSVTSYHEGKRKEYVNYIDEHGVPAFIKISERDTEETGVEIKIPTSMNQYRDWEVAVKNNYKYFKVQPKVSPKVELNKVPEMDEFGLYVDNNSFSYNKMLKVTANFDEYSVLLSEMAKHPELEEYGYIGFLSTIIPFAIGELDLDISRENLQFTKKTKNALVRKFKEIDQKILDKYGKLIPTTGSEVEKGLKIADLLKKEKNKQLFARAHKLITGKVIPEYCEFIDSVQLAMSSPRKWKNSNFLLTYSYPGTLSSVIFVVADPKRSMDGMKIKIRQAVNAGWGNGKAIILIKDAAPLDGVKTAEVVEFKNVPKGTSAGNSGPAVWVQAITKTALSCGKTSVKRRFDQMTSGDTYITEKEFQLMLLGKDLILSRFCRSEANNGRTVYVLPDALIAGKKHLKTKILESNGIEAGTKKITSCDSKRNIRNKISKIEQLLPHIKSTANVSFNIITDSLVTASEFCESEKKTVVWLGVEIVDLDALLKEALEVVVLKYPMLKYIWDHYSYRSSDENLTDLVDYIKMVNTLNEKGE